MSANATFSATVFVGRSLKSWKTTPILRRSFGTRPRASRATSSPSTTTRPLLGSSSRMRRRMSVDFPAPDEPTRKTKSAASIARSTSRSANVPFGKRLLTSSSVITGATLPLRYVSSTVRKSEQADSTQRGDHTGRMRKNTTPFGDEVVLGGRLVATGRTLRARFRARAAVSRAGALPDRELRLGRAGRGEGRDRGDLRVAGGHDLHAHRRAPENADLVERRADNDAGRGDEEHFLDALVDDLDRSDVAGLRSERGEDDALPAAALRRKLIDGCALAVPIRGDREHLGARPDDAHADDPIALPEANAGDALGRTAHRSGVALLERDALALLGREQDAVALVRRRDPRELVALPEGDRDEARAADVGVLLQGRLLDEALAGRHDEELGRARLAQRHERGDALALLHRLEDVLDRRALRRPARIRHRVPL